MIICDLSRDEVTRVDVGWGDEPCSFGDNLHLLMHENEKGIFVYSMNIDTQDFCLKLYFTEVYPRSISYFKEGTLEYKLQHTCVPIELFLGKLKNMIGRSRKKYRLSMVEEY